MFLVISVNFYMSSTCLQKIQKYCQLVMYHAVCTCGSDADNITNTVSKPYINNSLRAGF